MAQSGDKDINESESDTRYKVSALPQHCDHIGPEDATQAYDSELGIQYSFLFNKEKTRDEVYMKWYGSLSDLVRQDSKTSYANCFKFIKKMQALGLLPKYSGAVLYIQSDGCPKQYKCAAAMRMMGLLGLIFGISIDWLIHAPHHGKCLVDAIAGRDKYDLCNKMIHGMDDAQRDEFFKLLSEAMKAAHCLNNRELVKNNKKAQPTDGRLTLSEREYAVSNYELNTVPFSNCVFKIRKKYFNKEYARYHKTGPKKGKPIGPSYKTKVGHKEMFHFRTHWRMPIGWVAMRRIPCLCDYCHYQLSLPWQTELPLSDQPMFRLVTKCIYAPILGAHNDWNFVCAEKCKVSNDALNQQEENEGFRDALEDRLQATELHLEGAKFGIISCKADKIDAPNGLRLVRWVGCKQVLAEEEELNVSGKVIEPSGTTIQDCFYWHSVKDRYGWFEPPHIDPAANIKPVRHSIPIRLIMEANVKLKKEEGVVKKEDLRSFNQRHPRFLKQCVRLHDDTLKTALNEKHIRKEMETVYIQGECLERVDDNEEIVLQSTLTEEEEFTRTVLALSGSGVQPISGARVAMDAVLEKELKHKARAKERKMKVSVSLPKRATKKGAGRY